MTAINFPASPNNGDTFVNGDVVYTWDGVKWTAKGADPGHVLKAGDTMTGNLTVPSLNGGQLAGFRNRLINGFDFQGAIGSVINQRGYVAGTATTSAKQYCLDRWRIVVSGESLTYSTTGGQTFAVAPAGGIEQQIENNNYDTGVYTLSWEGNATASISSGGTGYTPVANGGQFNCIRGNDLVIRLAGGTFRRVQFEPGPAATPFEHRPIGTELALCQRYAYKLNDALIGNTRNAIDLVYPVLKHPVQMRANPTLEAGASFNMSAGPAGTPAISNGRFVGDDGKNQVAIFNSASNWSGDSWVAFTGVIAAEL